MIHVWREKSGQKGLSGHEIIGHRSHRAETTGRRPQLIVQTSNAMIKFYPLLMVFKEIVKRYLTYQMFSRHK